MNTMIIFDAHGPDHALRVTLENGEVEIAQWGELCEPNHDDETMPHIQTASMSLAECLKYAADDGRHNNSQRGRVVTGALAYLSHWGGSEDLLAEKSSPCEHFDGECCVCVPWKVGDIVHAQWSAPRIAGKLPTRGFTLIAVETVGGVMQLTLAPKDPESGEEPYTFETRDGDTWVEINDTATRVWLSNCSASGMRIETGVSP